MQDAGYPVDLAAVRSAGRCCDVYTVESEHLRYSRLTGRSIRTRVALSLYTSRNVNNSSAEEENKLRVFQVEGGRCCALVQSEGSDCADQWRTSCAASRSRLPQKGLIQM